MTVQGLEDAEVALGGGLNPSVHPQAWFAMCHPIGECCMLNVKQPAFPVSSPVIFLPIASASCWTFAGRDECLRALSYHKSPVSLLLVCSELC